MSNQIIINALAYIDNSTDRYKLKRTVLAINSAYADGESGLIVGQCKSLVEGLCKSILDESKVPVEADINLSKLAKKAVQELAKNSDEWKEQKTNEAFKKLINSFSLTLENAMSAIGTLRNEYCPLAHGRSSQHIPLDFVYAEFVAQQTDAILLFFLKLLDHSNSLKLPPITYHENLEFNEYVDEQHGSLNIFEDMYLASDILFQMNKSKYQAGLAEYKESLEEIEGQEID